MSFLRPDNLEQAFNALHQGASVIAGGTDWYPALPEGPRPGHILDITGLPGFDGISHGQSGWHIGAATTWSRIAQADLPTAFDGLRAAAREVGGIQIQNAGTIGGNLCNASPAADGVPPLLTLDASVVLVGPDGTRQMPLADFIKGPRNTARHPNELLQAIHLPDPGPARGGFAKLGARHYLVISIVMAAALLRMEQGRIQHARVAVGACSAVARRLPELEDALRGQAISDIAIAPHHLAALSPIDDMRASAAYRQEAAAELIHRALKMAATDG